MPTIKSVDMQVPPPGPPWLSDHFLDRVYRQQTLWLESGHIKVPISGFLNLTRLERKQMVFYGILLTGDMLSVRGEGRGGLKALLGSNR